MADWMSKRSLTVALLCFCIGVGAVGGLGLAIGARDAPFWTESPPQPMPTIQAPNFARLAEQLKPAVVNVSTTQTLKREPRSFHGFPVPQPFGEGGEGGPFQEFFERFFGGQVPQQELRRNSLGSGFIIAKDGYIVTNSHVVENATDIKVSLSNKQEIEAKIIGRDPKTDIALIKIEADRELPVVPLGDSDKLQVGEWVIAIGNPFALGHTVTAGIVSAKGRIIGAGPYDDFIQTDASINPGNSGGPLFNLNGEVVGINTAIVATGQGIGFALPINLAKEVLPQLRQAGKVARGWLGVQVGLVEQGLGLTVQELTPELAHQLGMPSTQGVVVTEVVEGSPADEVGIRRGDVILEANQQQITTVQDYRTAVQRTEGAQPVLFLIRRAGTALYVTVRPAE